MAREGQCTMIPLLEVLGLVTFLKNVSRKVRLGDFMLGLGMFMVASKVWIGPDR